MSIAFTLFTSTTPLTKRFSLDPTGKLDKTPAATMTAATATLTHCADLREFGALLDSLTPQQALAYGIAPGHPAAKVTTQASHKQGNGTITRTRHYFQFAPGPGVMMLDHDPEPGKPALSPDALVGILRDVCPPLVEGGLLRPSVSAGIHGPDGTPLTQAGGQRIYVPVQDASLIPRAGGDLVTLLWGAGFGSIRIGAAGQCLPRTLIDATVWQPERLDFAGPPILVPGLTRNPPKARLIGDPTALLDLRRVIDLADGAVWARAKKARATATSAAKPDADQARAAWVDEHAPALADRRGIDIEEAKAVLTRAAEKRTLTGDFLLIASDGEEVSVGELLDNPAKWHAKRFADPLEPDYSQDHRIAWANLRGGGRPYLFSHAHGGRRFELVRPSRAIQLVTGQRPRVVDSVLDLLRERRELYDLGEGAALTRLADGARLVPVNRDWLVDHLGRVARFYSIRMAKDPATGVDVPVEATQDAPTWAAASLMAKDGERGLPRLDAVVTAPTLRRDGSLLDEPGYDEPSRLLLILDSPDAWHIADRPTEDEAKAALDALWAPFHLFPLVDSVDRGVVLAAILTALIRPSLPTAPGFGFDAPTAGSGKTLLAQTIGALLLGDAPAALPPASNQDEEARKRLFSALLNGARVLLWDNVREPLGNGALDAFLTAPVFQDRILGKSETASVPNRALFLVTGNNLRLVGDTCRRVLVARMDPQMEKPYGRSFDFCPLQTATGNRPRLVTAGLTLIRAWIAAGRPRHGKGRTASFEAWDDLVRQTVCWVATWDDRFDDPLDATERAFEHDPETAKLAALLGAWHGVMGAQPATVAQIKAESSKVKLDGEPTHPALVDALAEIAGDARGNLNPRILGRWIERNAERRVGGLRFVRAGKSHQAQKWTVQPDTREGLKITPQTHQTPPHADGADGHDRGVRGVQGVSGGQPERPWADEEAILW